MSDVISSSYFNYFDGRFESDFNTVVGALGRKCLPPIITIKSAKTGALKSFVIVGGPEDEFDISPFVYQEEETYNPKLFVEIHQP